MGMWVEIKNTNGFYFASKEGGIKSKRSGKLLKQTNDGRYLRVNLSSRWRNVYVHRIIATTFIPNPENRPEVNHKDFNKHNNHFDNLEWATRQHNSDHLQKNKKIIYPSRVGENNDNGKLSKKQVIEIFDLKGISSSQEIANKYRISKSHVYSIWHKRVWEHLNLTP